MVTFCYFFVHLFSFVLTCKRQGNSPKIKEIWGQIVTEGSMRPEMLISMVSHQSIFQASKHGSRQLDGQNQTNINIYIVSLFCHTIWSGLLTCTGLLDSIIWTNLVF